MSIIYDKYKKSKHFNFSSVKELQMLTNHGASLKVSSEQHYSSDHISKNMSILEKCAENHHKQIVTKQEYSILPRAACESLFS